MSDIVTPNWLAYKRGQKMFREGLEQPPEPTDADIRTMSKDFCTWLGWMTARAAAFFERRRVMALLGADET